MRNINISVDRQIDRYINRQINPIIKERYFFPNILQYIPFFIVSIVSHPFRSYIVKCAKLYLSLRMFNFYIEVLKCFLGYLLLSPKILDAIGATAIVALNQSNYDWHNICRQFKIKPWGHLLKRLHSYILNITTFLLILY